MLSQKAKYALRALIVLASRPDRALSAAAVAEAARVPTKFLEQILGELRVAGLVASQRGRHGGYRLARPAESITFAAVIRLVDGPIAPLPCLSQTAYRRCADCADEANCAIRRAFADVVVASRQALDATTIAAARDFDPAPPLATVPDR
ncbi:MAG: Rrf2 family transcriptional regulator [Geminicoccaceae bacterium]|nr:MAG: Rrf2 family transcriptional regulator [Geminicoccaceae bacterium]